jgi:hypothetical protein
MKMNNKEVEFDKVNYIHVWKYHNETIFYN